MGSGGKYVGESGGGNDMRSCSEGGMKSDELVTSRCSCRGGGWKVCSVARGRGSASEWLYSPQKSGENTPSCG